MLNASKTKREMKIKVYYKTLVDLNIRNRNMALRKAVKRRKRQEE